MAAHFADEEKEPSESDEAMLEACLGCASVLMADAMFCRRCGEQRSMRKDVTDALRTLIGDRSIFRLEDLNLMSLSIRRLQEAVPGGVDMTMYRLKIALEQRFQQLLGSQRESGEGCTQGLTQRGFQALLTEIAVMLGVTGSSVALWLVDEARCLAGALVKPRQKPAGHRLVSPTVVRQLPCAPSTADALDAVRGIVEQRLCAPPFADAGDACGDRCERCCSTLPPDAQYCRRCGTERRRTQAAEKEERTRNNDTDEIVYLSNKHKLSVEEVKKRKAVFKELDADGNGRLSSDELLQALRKRYHISPGAELIPLRRCEVRNGDRSAGIDFEEYLLWSVSVGETEEGLECNVRDRELRKFAAASGLYLPDVEGARATFDRFAASGSRRLEQAAFLDVLSFLLKVSKPSDIPQSTLKRHWLSVAGFDASKTSVSLEEFLTWYFKTSLR